MSTSPRASLTASAPQPPLVPGGQSVVTATIVNHGSQAENFRLGVRGIEPGWVTFRPPALALGPGEQATVSVSIQPPTDAAPASLTPVVRLIPRSSGDVVAETGVNGETTGSGVPVSSVPPPVTTGQPGVAKDRSLPRWLVPAIAGSAVLLILLLVLGAVVLSRRGDDSPAAAGNGGRQTILATTSAVTTTATTPARPAAIAATAQSAAAPPPTVPAVAARAPLRGENVATFPGHTAHVRGVAWSPDGRALASGADDGTVRLWRAADGTPLATLRGHTDKVTSVAWSPDGATLASGSADRTVRLWRAAEGALVITLSDHTKEVTSLAWSPDGGRLASGSYDSTVRLWSANGQALASPFNHPEIVTSLAWSPDGAMLAAGTWDNTVRLWR